MEFKEKLYKTNHKRAYYRTRQFLMSFLVLISAGIAISVPAYVSLNNNDPRGSKAEENPITESVEITEHQNEYLNY